MKKIIVALASATLLSLGLTVPALAVTGPTGPQDGGGGSCGGSASGTCTTAPVEPADDTTAIAGPDVEIAPDPAVTDAPTDTPETSVTVDDGTTKTTTSTKDGTTIQRTLPSGGGSCTGEATTAARTTDGNYIAATVRIKGCSGAKTIDSVTYTLNRYGKNCGNEVGSWITKYNLNADTVGGWNPPAWSKDCVKGQGLMTKTYTPSKTYTVSASSSSANRCFSLAIVMNWGGVSFYDDTNITTKSVCLPV